MSEPIREFEEMYLKTLYEFYVQNPQKPIRNSRIAESLGVSQAASSEMVQRLASKGILYHIPYRGATLTEGGVAAAARIKRRECLMEVFLVSMLDYRGDVKAAACRMEHALNDELESAIDRLLGYPEFTPSGERIPAVNRSVEPIASSMLIPLRALPEGTSGKIEMVILEGAENRTISNAGVAIGAVVRSTEGGFVLEGDNIEISTSLSSRILVRTQ